MELILVRHGTTRGNKEKRFIGTLDVPLIPEGEALARRLSGSMPEAEHIYRSPLLRCKQTADLLWPGVAQTVVPELRETDFGPFEGKNHEELKDDPLYRQWLASPNFAALPVGEGPEACARRAAEAIRRVVQDANAKGFHRAGVVSHGGTLMGILSQFGRPERSYYDWFCPNCGGYLVQVEEQPLRLEVLAAVGGAAE